jgi:hypothetical protein
MNSSVSNTTGSPLRCGIVTGTISSLKLAGVLRRRGLLPGCQRQRVLRLAA